MIDKRPAELALAIAKRLTAMRLQRTWTREVLAEKSGVNVYTLKRFERTGKISFERLIAISFTLDASAEVEKLFKPRQRVNVDDWQVQPEPTRRRGKRRTAVERETVEA